MEGVGGVWKDTMMQPKIETEMQPKIETEMLRLTVNPPPPSLPMFQYKT